MTIKGYKVFNPDWTARHDNFKYKVGKEYEMGEEIIPCKRGFHFCEKLEDCFKYYIFATNLKVAEVEGSGQIKREGNKICCSHIRIVKEIPMTDALNLANDGECNLGVNNRGNRNQGDGNQGDGNRGYYNQGNRNQGDGNQGDGNQGNYNQGEATKGTTTVGTATKGASTEGTATVGTATKETATKGTIT